MSDRAPRGACLDPEALGRLAEGRAAVGEIAAAEEHLAMCRRCSARLSRAIAAARFANDLRERLGAIDPDSSSVGRQRKSPDRADPAVRTFDGDPESAEGERLRGYRLLHELSSGGQATVYRAIHVATGRHVAVKAIRSNSTRERARLSREARLVARLRHPGIVTVHDCGALADGTFAIAMELLEGEPLDEWTRRLDAGPLGVSERSRERSRDAMRRKLTLLAKVGDAVAHAHLHAVVHRDLKPSNIVVAAGDDPRVLDFGVAREMAGLEEITLVGEFAGTLAYAAPERMRRGAEAEGVDVRSDVYSLGVILYAMVCGRLPYRTDDSVEHLVQAIVHEAPIAPQKDVHGRRLDRDISTILLKALAKDPNDRYQSAAALSADIRRHLEGSPIDARVAHPLYVMRKVAWRHRVAVSAAVIALLLAVAAAIQLSVAYREASLAREAAAQESIRLATQLRETTLHESTMLEANCSRQRAEMAIWTEVLAPKSPSAIGAGPGHPEFCAAIWALRQIHARDPCVGSTFLGERPIRCALDADGAQAWALRDDGQVFRLACPELRVLETIRVEGGTDAALNLDLVEIEVGRRRVVMVDEDRRHGRIHELDTGRVVVEFLLPPPWIVKSIGFAPDGRTVALLEGGGLAVASRDRDDFAILPAAPAAARYAVLEANNEVAAYGLAMGGLGVVDLATGALLHHQRNAAWLPQVDVPLAMSSDGTVVYSRDGVIASSLDGTSRRTLSTYREPIWSFSLSEDQRVAVGWCRSGSIRVFAIDGDRPMVEFSGHPFGATSMGVNAVLDGNGGRVLSAGRSGDLRLWEVQRSPWIVRRAGHSATVHTLVLGAGADELLSISSDGTIGRWQGGELLERRPLPTDQLVAYAAITPDGGRVALDAREQQAHMVVRDVETAEDLVAPLPCGVYAGPFDFSPDGRWLAAGTGCTDARPQFASANVTLVDLDRRDVISLSALGGRGVRAVQFSGDGAALVLGMRSGDLYLLHSTDPGFPALSAPIATGVPIRCAAFSPDGSKVAVGHDDGQITLWDVTTGRKLSERSGHTHWLMQIAWSPDGAVIASAAYDGAISIWCAESMRQIAVIRDEPIPIHAMCFSRDGTRLHFADADGNVSTLHIEDYDRAIAANVEFWIEALNRRGVQTTNAETMRAWARSVLEKP